jgi:hypothetical protein
VGFKQEWEKTMQLIEQTQSDQDFMRSKVDSLSSRKQDNVYSPTEQPSAAFITRLEKALLPLSNELSLNISEQFCDQDRSRQQTPKPELLEIPLGEKSLDDHISHNSEQMRSSKSEPVLQSEHSLSQNESGYNELADKIT